MQETGQEEQREGPGWVKIVFIAFRCFIIFVWQGLLFLAMTRCWPARFILLMLSVDVALPILHFLQLAVRQLWRCCKRPVSGVTKVSVVLEAGTHEARRETVNLEDLLEIILTVFYMGVMVRAVLCVLALMELVPAKYFVLVVSTPLIFIIAFVFFCVVIECCATRRACELATSPAVPTAVGMASETGSQQGKKAANSEASSQDSRAPPTSETPETLGRTDGAGKSSQDLTAPPPCYEHPPCYMEAISVASPQHRENEGSSDGTVPLDGGSTQDYHRDKVQYRV